MQKSKIKNQKCKHFLLHVLRFRIHDGFTLLETVVALSVILAALVGPVAVITRSLASFTTAKNKIIATNLAQEGIELVRAVKENNVLCDQLDGPPTWFWDHDPGGPRGQRIDSTPRQVSATDFVTDTCGAFALNSPRMSLYTDGRIKFDSTTGIYGHSGADTIFTRRINIQTPPSSPLPDTDTTPIIPAGDQMDIISTVNWTDRGIPKNIVLRERAYNWK